MRLVASLAAGVAAAVVLASAAAAAGAGMHPHLGARLAGMGEHGVVNLTSQAKAGRLCWTFDLGKLKGFTGASIHVGATGRVLLHLGMHYATKGCTRASAMTLEHLEAKPAAYRVFLDAKGHPGELRGKLFAGMAHPAGM